MVPTFVKSAVLFPGTVSMERFHVPSGCWVSAIRSAGRKEYGSQPICDTVSLGSRATSVAALYRMGGDAFSKIHPIGNVSGSPTGTCGVRIGSAAERGAVTSALDVYLRLEKADCRGASSVIDRKSTRLNSSHLVISYAVFC